jgi:hypothetical protein
METANDNTYPDFKIKPADVLCSKVWLFVYRQIFQEQEMIHHFFRT